MIQQYTYDFLSALEQNNNRDWFNENKQSYETAKDNFLEFIEHTIAGIAAFEPLAAEIAAKKAMFRIYRDTRFSKDKTPYKTNFGASIIPGDKKIQTAGYYVHLSPKGCFLGGGIYMPESKRLKGIRDEISYNPTTFKQLITDPTFVKHFKEVHSPDKLKTAPKGFEKDDPMIEHLRNKHFIMKHDFSSTTAMQKDFVAKAVSIFEAMKPFNDFLNGPLAD